MEAETDRRDERAKSVVSNEKRYQRYNTESNYNQKYYLEDKNNEEKQMNLLQIVSNYMKMMREVKSKESSIMKVLNKIERIVEICLYLQLFAYCWNYHHTIFDITPSLVYFIPIIFRTSIVHISTIFCICVPYSFAFCSHRCQIILQFISPL